MTLLDTAARDLRRMGPGPERKKVHAGLERLVGEDAALDIKPVKGSPPWLRYRIGDYRVIYRPVEDPQRGRVLVVQRVVHRRDLDAAAANLPEVTDD